MYFRVCWFRFSLGFLCVFPHQDQFVYFLFLVYFLLFALSCQYYVQVIAWKDLPVKFK